MTVGQAYSFQPAASDPDGDALRFGIANKPTWADFDIVSGRLSGTPTDANAGALCQHRDLAACVGRQAKRHAAGL